VPSKANQKYCHEDSDTIRAETDIRVDNESLSERNIPFVFSFASQANDADVALKVNGRVLAQSPQKELRFINRRSSTARCQQQDGDDSAIEISNIILNPKEKCNEHSFTRL